MKMELYPIFLNFPSLDLDICYFILVNTPLLELKNVTSKHSTLYYMYDLLATWSVEIPTNLAMLNKIILKGKLITFLCYFFHL